MCKWELVKRKKWKEGEWMRGWKNRVIQWSGRKAGYEETKQERKKTRRNREIKKVER